MSELVPDGSGRAAEPRRKALREADRNARLRRADWRFLLDSPAPGTTVCVGSSALAAATAAFTNPGRVLDQAGRADLVVATDPNPATLDACRRTLRAGGELYVEFYSPRRTRHPERLAGYLEAHGFNRVRVYWPWPPRLLAPVKFWIPLHPHSALEFFRGEHSPAPPPIMRAGGRLLLGAWSFVAARPMAWPLCAVASAGSADEAAVGGSVPQWVTALETATPAHRPDSWALQTLGPRSHSKVVGLSFDAAGDEPRSIVKLGRVPEAQAALRHEAAVLAGLPDSIAGVPRVHFADDTPAGFAVAQSVIRGVPLWRFARSERREALALRVTTWAADLANATAGVPTNAGMSVADQEFERFLGGFARVAPEALLAESRARLQALRDCPRACEHRDLGPWNILIDSDGAPGVLDWESSEPRGLQGADLHYFLAYHAFFHTGAMRSRRHLDVYGALRTRGTLADLRERCLRSYEERTGLDPAFRGPLALYTWIVHAGAELTRLQRDAGGPPPARALRSSLFFRLWLWEASAVRDSSVAVRVAAHRSPQPAGPQVSLVICTRDRPGLVHDTVLSVLAGDTVPAELIIIDQSQAPNPELSALRSDHCDVRYVHVRSTGLATARNTGIEAARHALIVFLDDDMRVEAGWLRALVRAATAAGPRAAITGQVRPEDPAPPGTFVPSTITATERRTYAGRQRHEVLSAGNSALWRDAFEEVGLFDPRLGAGARYPSAEDNDLCFRLFEAGYQVVYEPAAVVYHRAWRPLSFATRLRWDYGVGQGAYYAKHIALRDRFFARRLGRDVGLRLLQAPRHLLADPRHAWREVVYAAAVAFGATGFLLRERRHPE